MSYTMMSCKIDNEIHRKPVLTECYSGFFDGESVDYDKYLKYIGEMVTVPTHQKNPKIIVVKKTMSRELAIRLTEDGKFNSKKYYEYIKKCENLL